MIPRKILEQYPKEDWETMQRAQKHLKIFDNITDKPIKKSILKELDPQKYYDGLYRSTFHRTAVRLIKGREYRFINDYCFTS